MEVIRWEVWIKKIIKFDEDTTNSVTQNCYNHGRPMARLRPMERIIDINSLSKGKGEGGEALL